MADMNVASVVKLAIDTYKGTPVKYSVGESMEVLRAALVDANNGSTTIDYKAMRDGKCQGLFALLEEILSRTIIEGLQGDEFFNSIVENRNVSLGDKPVFVVEDTDVFIPARSADGTTGIRRQRLGGVSEFTIATSYYWVRVFEEMNRILSGRVDFNSFITKVSESFRRQMLNDIYGLWTSATATELGGTEFYQAGGNYDEATLLKMIEHVEAEAGGKPATVLGTASALRRLAPSIVGVEARTDLYTMGYFGKFYGNNVVKTPQRHKIGSKEFILPDNELTVVAGDDRPIKFVYEGNPIIIYRDPTVNGDLTQEYLYGERYGLGIVLNNGNAGIGKYQFAD